MALAASEIASTSGTKWEKLLEDAKTPGPGGFLATVRQQKFHEVHPVLRKVKPSCFENSAICLGLVHFCKDSQGETDLGLPIRKGDDIRIDVVNSFLGEIHKTSNDWRSVAQEVVANPEHVQNLYHGQGASLLTLDDVQSILALDAIFVASLLEYFFNPQERRSTHEVFRAAGYSTCQLLLRDISNLENQIPLSLIGEVIRLRMEYAPGGSNIQHEAPGLKSRSANDTFGFICRGLIKFWLRYFPSFKFVADVESELVVYERTVFPNFSRERVWLDDCDHLLHCLAKVIWAASKKETSESSDVTVSMAESDRKSDGDKCRGKPPSSLPRHLCTASVLQQQGIEFVGREGCSRPEFLVPALHLPVINIIDDSSERLWRNFLAFEDARVKDDSFRFRLYMQLMNQLIHGEEDVSILCGGQKPVIRWHRLEDTKAVATLFNSILVNHYVPRDSDWEDLRRKVMNYESSIERCLTKGISRLFQCVSCKLYVSSP